MKTRNEIREIALRIIYKINIFDDANVYYDVDDLIKEEEKIENDFVNSLVNGVIEKKDELTSLVNKYMSDWTLSRLNKVDQALFLLSSYELKYLDTPSIVSINEWVEISKKYSDDKVTKMLNGVLDNVYHSEDVNE
ncbi:MAG TPA: transcription antitermination factor NusB [Candidatus Onthousia faecipullorum]|uniref:Transcription antitermination protein NusB n=1 Tax=Candidatus Onthousia faecipullorum TaxID=2840887 RepID=A0A9D1GCK3_9FIRM|nr:transcription antitermination factor NusB [Candidatus Onthousia faecipullorum]